MNEHSGNRPQDSTANALFLLMFNLSQMSENEKIIEAFLKAIQKLHPGSAFSYEPAMIATHSGHMLKISTYGGDYGYIKFDSSALTYEDHSLLQNASTMLAQILRKNEQTKLLSDEKLHLKSLVEERTAHLAEYIEKQKDTERTLAENEKKYHLLFEKMTQGVVYQDSKGAVISANPAAEKIFGLSFNQMRGETSMNPEWKVVLENGEVLSGENHPEIIALKTGKPVLNFIQGIYNQKNKDLVWISTDSIPQFLEGKKEPYQVLSIFADITSQYKAEKAEQMAIAETTRLLEESNRTRRALLSVVEDQKITEATLHETQAYLENLLDYANAPIIVWDNDFRIKKFNKAFENLTGIAAANAMDHDLGILFPERSRKESLAYIRSTSGKHWETVEIEVADRRGEIRTLLWNSAMIFASDGETIVATIAQAQDITGRKRAEAESLSLNERLQDLVHAIKSLSSAHSLDEIQKIAVSSARVLTKCDGAAIVLREGELCCYVDTDSIGPLWKGEKFPLGERIAGWVILNNEPAIIPDIYKDDRVLKSAYEPTFVRSLAVVPVRVESPIAALGNYWSVQYNPSELDLQLLQTLADATAIALENVFLLKNLEERVRLRTADLQAANKELESFSYSVSHDLRAPLRAIDGYVRILLEDFSASLDDEGKRVCSVISVSAQKMGKLIDDLLSFSRTGRIAIAQSSINMKALVTGLFDEMTTEAARKRMDFSVGDIPPAFGDPALIKQVWTNLLNNAIKFSSKKERTRIEIGAEDRGDEIIYSITDNGAGFDMEYADKLFGVFQRLHGQNEFEGTGVGLAIVQRIIARHGGKIWAKSEIEKGATFYFSMKTGGSP